MKKILVFLVIVYLVCYVWPGRWRYDHIGNIPIRTERVTGRMQFCTLQGWNWQLPMFGNSLPRPRS